MKATWIRQYTETYTAGYFFGNRLDVMDFLCIQRKLCKYVPCPKSLIFLVFKINKNR